MEIGRVRIPQLARHIAATYYPRDGRHLSRSDSARAAV